MRLSIGQEASIRMSEKTKAIRSSKRIRVGIVGAGFISDFHIRALKAVPEAELVAVCDVEVTRAQELGRKWGIPNTFERIDDLPACGVEVVHILLPPALHAEATIACLRGGCHVLVEKPMAVTVAECRDMEAAAARYGRQLAVNHNFTFDPAFRRLVSAVRDRSLGALEHVTASVNVPLRQLTAGQHDHWMFQSPGNIVLEQGPHPLSQIQYLMGSVNSVQAMASGQVTLSSGSRFYDTWQISLECERGTAQCFLSFGRDHIDSWLHAIGQDGTAWVDLRRNVVLFSNKTRFMDPIDKARHSLSQGWSQISQGVSNLSGYGCGFLKIKPPADSFTLGFTAGIRAFYDSLLHNLPLPEGMAQGRSVIETCERVVAQSGVDRTVTEVTHAIAQ